MEKYKLTLSDIAALRRADAVCVSLCPPGRVGTMRIVRRADENGGESETTIYPPVTLHYGYDASRVSCFAMVHLYWSQGIHNPLMLLRAGDALGFEFYPDAHSTTNLARVGMHGDALYMLVDRGTAGHEKKNNRPGAWRLEVAAVVCPENTARMCRGAEPQDWYLRDAATAPGRV